MIVSMIDSTVLMMSFEIIKSQLSACKLLKKQKEKHLVDVIDTNKVSYMVILNNKQTILLS